MVSHRSRIRFGVLFAILIAGFASDRSATATTLTLPPYREQPALHVGPTDINMFTDTLRKEGHIVLERSLFHRAVPAIRSRRLLVNGDVVDVFAFGGEAIAAQHAHQQAVRYPLSDVYQKGDLVVVHRGRSSLGLSITLNALLGRLV